MTIVSAAAAPTEQVYYVQQDIWSKVDAVIAEIHPAHFKDPKAIRALLEIYRPEEVVEIFKDFETIRNDTFKTARKEQIFILTSGGPGAGKSMHLEKALDFQKDLSIKNALVTDTNTYAYVDPDRRALFFMKNTFVKDVESNAKTPTESYMHWRNGSQFIAETLLALALKDGYAIAYGTTMTPPPAIIKKLMDSIRGMYGYKVEMHHLSTSDDIRVQSIKEREANGIVQSTEQDVRSKGKAFFERLPAYLENVDTLRLFYRPDMNTVIEAGKKTASDFVVLNPEALTGIQELHDGACGQGFWNGCLSPTQ